MVQTTASALEMATVPVGGITPELPTEEVQVAACSFPYVTVDLSTANDVVVHGMTVMGALDALVIVHVRKWATTWKTKVPSLADPTAQADVSEARGASGLPQAMVTTWLATSVLVSHTASGPGPGATGGVQAKAIVEPAWLAVGTPDTWMEETGTPI